MNTATRLLPLLVVAAAVQCAQAASVSLAGDWGVLLDPQNSGEANGLPTAQYWATKEVPAVKLPGSLQSQKIGDLPSARSPWTARLGLSLLNNPKYQPYQKEGEFKSPFWLTPDRVYVGSAWFKREVEIPAAWKDQRIVLTLERPHWETTVFVDGQQVAPPQNSLGTPHAYNLSSALSPGKHTLILRVDNRVKIPVGNDASSITDQSQSNWNGIVGDITLTATPKVYLEDVQIFPDLAGKKIKVRVAIGNLTGQAGKGMLHLQVDAHSDPLRDLATPGMNVPVTWTEAGGKVEVDYDMSFAGVPWDEFHPHVYALETSLTADGSTGQSEAKPLFGMREVTTKGNQLLLNGKPLQLRGTLECCIFPLTGYPPTGPDGAAYWKKICTQLKAFGLNHLRFHSWCPPEIAFQVADEMGVYLQIEGSAWAAFGSSGLPTTEAAAPDAGGRGGAALDHWIVRETDAMLKAYGNHPSFLLMATANEPGSRTNQPNAAFLSALLTKWKAADPRHLYTAGSNWPNVPEADFQVMSRPRMNNSNELTHPPQTMSDYHDVVVQYADQPVISHETGQWCVYPNFDEIKKYTGVLHAGNYEIFQDFLNKAGMGDQAGDFLMASGKFQALLYKEEIEAILRTPNIGGFQLLDLHDFPGQGTAPVGVVDAFWDEKPYVTAAEYKRFAGAVVPLALFDRRIFTNDQSLAAELKVSHFGAADLSDARLDWKLTEPIAAQTIKEGREIVGKIPAGALANLAKITVPLETVRSPKRLILQVDISGPPESVAPLPGVPAPLITRPIASNSWEVWVYPQDLDIAPPQNVAVVTRYDDAITALSAGKNVLLLPGPNAIAGNTQGSFAPIFWNRVTFPTAQYHTLSILCDPKHAAFKDFPTDFYSNWQWSELQQRGTCKPMMLTGLPRELKPLVQIIDDWDQARKLGLVIEAKVGTGKLILCSIDLRNAIDSRPVARQLRYSLQQYMASPAFNPPTAITEAQLRALLQ